MQINFQLACKTGRERQVILRYVLVPQFHFRFHLSLVSLDKITTDVACIETLTRPAAVEINLGGQGGEYLIAFISGI